MVREVPGCIIWNEESREFHLRNGHVSYLMRILEDGLISGIHFGVPLPGDSSYPHLLRRKFWGSGVRREGLPADYAPDLVRTEYPVYGSGDFRVPAFSIEGADGTAICRPVYAGHRILREKPPLPGLPSTWTETEGEADTLELTLRDERLGVEVILSYTVWERFPVVARHAVIRNSGTAFFILRSAMSAVLDLPDSEWDMVHLSGAWGRECRTVSRKLEQGRQSISSSRGASGHQQNPFLALKRRQTTEEFGEVYGFSLVYSGNFLAEIECDPYGVSRVRIGINPEHFSWRLEPGEEFTTPEAILAYSDKGFGHLSETFHELFRTRLSRSVWRTRPRPVLINNWEATYFAFTEEKLLRIARSAKDLGIELFVLDDGWFGERNDDTCSLGDWQVNRTKLPEGIDGFARKINDLGMKFGIWLEPEMVNPQSRLYEEHPDWAVGIPGVPPTLMRNQLVLDLSRRDVIEYLYGEIASLLKNAPVSYVKWDMNRNITEPDSSLLPSGRKGEFFHRYILGLYELYDRVTAEFPEVLFESCSGGGGRFDPGILYYAPQAWTSDDTDAVERLSIQRGASLCYPTISMGAHVSAVPNHQVGRITPLSTRASVAFFGAFGYELDPSLLSAEERLEISDQISFYKIWRETIQLGRFLRLSGPFTGAGDSNETAWIAVSGDGRRAVVGFYRVLNRPNPGFGYLRLRGLDNNLRYRISVWPSGGDAAERENTGVRWGSELMGIGLLFGGDGVTGSKLGDFWSRLFTLEAV